MKTHLKLACAAALMLAASPALAAGAGVGAGAGVTGATTTGDINGTTFGGECWGQAEITADSYADTLLCVARQSDTDTYAYRMAYNTDGWDWTVIGGSGKFAGATGTGHVTAGWGDTKFGDRLTYTNKGSITFK